MLPGTNLQIEQHETMVLVFIIVGKNDRPLYELEIASDGRASGSAGSLSEQLSLTPFPKTAADSSSRKDDNHLSHFIIHSSLDIVDEAVWRNKDVYAVLRPLVAFYS